MKFYRKLNREIVTYLICGVITTLVNYTVYFLLREFTGLSLTVSNIVAFLVAVTQAYFTNKFFVYQKYDCAFKVMVKEFSSFVTLRVVSMGIETFLLFVLVTYAHYWEYGVKVAVSVLVVILNYLFGKFITFKRRTK